MRDIRDYIGEWLFDKTAFVYNAKRNDVPAGYPHAIDLVEFKNGDKKIVSYGDTLVPHLAEIKKGLYPANLKLFQESYVYIFKDDQSEIFNSSKILRLENKDKDDFVKYFAAVHNLDIAPWIGEYFASIVKSPGIYGIWQDGKIVSSSDSPDIPYLPEIFVEVGVSTLKEYRKKGYGKAIMHKLCKSIVKENKIPVIIIAKDNKASLSMVNSLGYKKLGILKFYKL